MYKKIVSVFLVILIVIGAIYILTPDDSNPNKVFAEDYRGGWLLLPDGSDTTGVFTDSTFTLKSETDTSLSEVVEIFSIDGQEKPGIVQIENNVFRITPNVSFDKNKLYTFRIKRLPDADITWTFQTSAPFMITRSLPSNQTTNVPTDTGIELYFSHSEYGNPDKYFEIIPAVEGRFERHKNAYVFIPKKPLEYGKLYTVTVKKGLQTKDGNETLESDFIFKFETKLEEKEQNRYDTGYIFFNKVLSEYNTEEKPILPVNYYFNSNSKSNNEKIIVQGSVYSYKSVDDFLRALDDKSKIPVWAYYSYLNDNLTDTNGLSKVMTFENEMQKDAQGYEDKYIRLPSNLPEGYYLVDCTWEDIRFQTFIEVTDLSVYMTSDSDSILFWVNDIKTGNPVEGSTVSIHKDNNQSWETNDKGVALFTPEKSSESDDKNNSYEKYFKIQSPDGRTAVIRKYENQYNRYSYYYDMINFSNEQNNYWRYIQLDRTLYKPNDTVFFWGFLKNRVEEEKIDRVTVEITRGGYYSDYGGEGWYCFPTLANEPVAKTTIQVKDGAFDGNVKLPFLEQGNYLLQIKIGDKIVKSTYLEVQNYIKPAYKMEISKDKKVIFWDETVEFTVKTAFFEGTALPGLDVDYQFDFYQGKSVNGSGKTDGDGQFNISIVPGANTAQGETWSNFFGNAALPESGQIYANEELRIFANDINVMITAKLSKDSDTAVKTGLIDFKVNDIVLDRINEGTAENDWDYLGDPSESITLSGYIIKNRWIKTQDGTYYDFINKKVMPKYRYDLKKETVTAIDVITDNNGEASFTFNAPDLDDGYYTYEVSCKDNRSKTMKFSGHIGEYWVYNYYDIDDNRYFLDGVKENYKDDSTVSLEYKKGMDLLPDASYLFIRSQNGIVDYTKTNKPAYEFKMTQISIPNIFVNGIYFNGKTYVNSGNVNIVYDYSDKELFIEAKADKEAYKPGEQVVIKIKAKDKSGKGIKAIVNAGIVDEALFSLRDMTVETLRVLYEFVPSGISQSYATHINSELDLYNYSGGYDEGLDVSAVSSKEMEGNVSLDSNKSGVVREKFEDTALFETIILDDNGDGEIKFTLPDNITSWRVTLTGISQNLDAGSSTESLIVSLPFFVNYSFNNTYIAGDKAYVGVTGYGNSLSEGDEITYMVSTSSNPSLVNEVKGKAFERINIPVGTLSIDDKFILIKAKSSSGFEDALKHSIDVKSSYHEISKSEYYDLVPGIKINGGTGGNTRLLFMDKGRGMYYPALMSYIWQGGNRIDQQLPRLVSEELLKTYFDSDDEFLKDESFKAADYQTEDGGIAILPYGPSDFELTARLVPFLKDTVDMFKLKRYLYSVYEDDNIGSVKGAALYGLAVLREPVLLEIGKAASVNNAGLKNLLYLSLAYCELGEEPQAKRLYDEKISAYVKRSGKYSWIDNGRDKDDVLETTALGLMLSTYIDNEDGEDGEDGEGFYKYCLENRTNDILINMEILAYIKNQIETADTVTGSFTFTYMGKTEKVVLEQGRMVSKDIPSANISDFVIDKVEGNVALVSIFKQPPTGLETPDSKISVSRSYFNLKGEKTNTFKQDDVVKVQIEFDFDAKAIDGSYEITDYLPSGLKPIENTWIYPKTADFRDAWYGKIDGQKNTFYVYHSGKYHEYKDYNKITYYARVISTGTYTAESTIIQGVGNTAGINQGVREILTIN